MLLHLMESMFSFPYIPVDHPSATASMVSQSACSAFIQNAISRDYILITSSRIVASLVRAQPLEFFWNILRWLVVAIPATWTNSWLSYIQNKLAIAYRTRLTKEVLKQYLGEELEGPRDKVYYKLCMRSTNLHFISITELSFSKFR